MKQFLIYMLISVYTLTSSVAQVSYKEVVNYLFQHYDLSEQFYIHHTTLEHRPEGWILGIYDYQDLDNPISQHTIWTPQDLFNPANNLTKLPSAIQLEDLDNSIFNRYNVFTDQFALYDVNYYFGYSGWDWDVIQALHTKKPLSTQEKEQLARAYTNYAMGYLSNQYGFVTHKHHLYRTPKDPDSTYEQARIDSFKYFAYKTVDLYKEILSEDPTYITPVGNILYKYENEKLDIDLKLDIYGATRIPKTIWEHISYPDTFTQQFKVLEQHSTKPKIFITWGDNETYYMRYLDLKNPELKNIVINFNLLSSIPYLIYIQKTYPQLKTDFPREIYRVQDYINMQKLNNEPENITWSQFKQAIKLPDSLTNLNFSFQKPKQMVSYKLQQHKFDIDLNNKAYVLLNQLALWDLLYLNADQYDIYLSMEPQQIKLPNELFEPINRNYSLHKLK